MLLSRLEGEKLDKNIIHKDRNDLILKDVATCHLFVSSQEVHQQMYLHLDRFLAILHAMVNVSS